MSFPAGRSNPLDLLSADAIRQAQQALYPPTAPRPTLNDQEKRDAGELVRSGGSCLFCAGIHVGASTPACPRLASGKLNGDGAVVEFSFWPDGQWDTSRVVFVADVAENEEVVE